MEYDNAHPEETTATSNLDNTFSIDEIKGIKTETEQTKVRAPKRKVEPKEVFTTTHLIQNKGIPKVIAKGRKLNTQNTNNIVKQSDSIMSMYHQWANKMYGIDQFEDIMTRTFSFTRKEEIRNMMANYRDVEEEKYRIQQTDIPNPNLEESNENPSINNKENETIENSMEMDEEKELNEKPSVGHEEKEMVSNKDINPDNTTSMELA